MRTQEEHLCVHYCGEADLLIDAEPCGEADLLFRRPVVGLACLIPDDVAESPGIVSAGASIGHSV